MPKYTLSITIFVGLFVAVCFLNACHSSSASSNSKIVGRVTDAETGQPIQGARVADHMYGGSTSTPCREAWTGEDGEYVLNTWYEEHTLVCSAPGYPPVLTTLLTKVLKKEKEVEMNITLSKKPK